MLVISCHADTGFREHRLARRCGGIFYGHLDNFAGVYCVMQAFFSGRLNRPNARIELTYGEESGFAGAREVLETLRPRDFVIVVDVSGTPTEMDFVIEKCGDALMRRFLTRSLAGMKYDIYEGCLDPIADRDETDVYRAKCPATCFVGVPCAGGDYNAGMVSCKQASLEAVAEALCRLAENFGAFCAAEGLRED